MFFLASGNENTRANEKKIYKGKNPSLSGT